MKLIGATKIHQNRVNENKLVRPVFNKKQVAISIVVIPVYKL